ncbi:MAG: tRNA lysidine(34) synthetase TilS [Prolixibacteraceae bacterium]|jgi:tRNA(Ile)-lysidine synthase|nr:tRNA lysidine(34) synthetase TilS [Prolixibacteraceae bacterium]
MLKQFLTYIREEELFDPLQRVLLAVSGGMDSMVMLYLFQKSGYDFSVAHCNFQLRGGESDGDEQFVANYCDEHNIRLFVTRFDTQEYARQEGISIEMAARDLRYGWFNKLMDEEHFDCLATAHHQDDVMETFFINLGRGTGIRGLSGIKPKSGRLIRPILFADRLSIRNYAALHQIQCREDSSNSDTGIRRNFIRHRILPVLDEFHPSFRKNMLKTIANLNQTEILFQQKIDEIKAVAVAGHPWGETIRISALGTGDTARTVLFELIREKGFSAEQTNDILGALESGPGKKFYSPSHRLVKDRDELIITALENESPELFYIDENCSYMEKPFRIKMERKERDSSFRFSTNPLVADFDLDRLEFPLILRKWQEGEYFQPLGMKGYKKLSDYFIDEKYSIPEKENAWILASGNKMVWVVGKRIDDRFKITLHTKNVLRISVAMGYGIK